MNVVYLCPCNCLMFDFQQPLATFGNSSATTGVSSRLSTPPSATISGRTSAAHVNTHVYTCYRIADSFRPCVHGGKMYDSDMALMSRVFYVQARARLQHNPFIYLFIYPCSRSSVPRLVKYD